MAALSSSTALMPADPAFCTVPACYLSLAMPPANG
jgi:hypothetical protein